MGMRDDEPRVSTSEPDPRVFFAAERTFLAWIRTGLALMGFGVVAHVARGITRRAAEHDRRAHECYLVLAE